MLFPCTPPRIHPCGPHHAPHSSLLKRAADRLAGLAQREHGFPSNRCSSDAVFVLNPQPTLPAPKAHVSVLPDNLPCFAKRKARHLKKLETIQRRLAWPPRRDDIANTEMVQAFCFRCTVLHSMHSSSLLISPLMRREPHRSFPLAQPAFSQIADIQKHAATSFDAPASSCCAPGSLLLHHVSSRHVYSF